MYVKLNSEKRLNLCIMDLSHMVMQFNKHFVIIHNCAQITECCFCYYGMLYLFEEFINDASETVFPMLNLSTLH